MARVMLRTRIPPPPEGGRQRGRLEDVLSCDYNGWNDAPEEEREWFDQHPEIWGGSPSETAMLLRRVTRVTRSARRGGMAA